MCVGVFLSSRANTSHGLTFRFLSSIWGPGKVQIESRALIHHGFQYNPQVNPTRDCSVYRQNMGTIYTCQLSFVFDFENVLHILN